MVVQLDYEPESIEVDAVEVSFTRRDIAAILAWCTLIVVVAVVGRVINQSFATNVLAPPLFGRFQLRITPATFLALSVGCTIVWFGPRFAARVPWPRLLLLTTCAGAAWALSLALVDAVHALTGPLAGTHDYLANVQGIESPASWLASFADQIESLSLHAQGHPPGMILIFWALAWLGFGGTAWATVLVVSVGVSASAPTLIVVRAMAGEAGARNLAPFLALTPAAVWIVTSADALFMGVSAWGLALLAVGARRESDPLVFVGGVLLGLSLFLTYGAVGLAPVAFVVLLATGYRRGLLFAPLGVLAVAGLFLASGFWWFDGFSSTVARYEVGVASERPFAFFVVANLAAFALALGPAVAAGLGRFRRSPTAALTGAALLAVFAADLSGLSKGEVERIWLIFVPWVLATCATFELSRARGMLALQGIAALAIQSGVRTPW
jgi:methylthioxylose transferase